MIKVGLTGGIGSGKTFIAEHFSKLNIPIYNSDIRGKHLMDNSADVKQQLIKAFGQETFTTNGLNRKYLSELVFNDKSKLNTINNIVHPAVANDFKLWQAQQQAPYIIKEAAILIESGAYKELDYLIVVTAPEQLRITRVVERDNMTREQVQQRISNQISDKERLRHANFVINNNGIMLVEQQVLKTHNNLLKHC